MRSECVSDCRVLGERTAPAGLRAHARSGDAVAIASYLGNGTVFDEAVTTFSERYADQNEADYDQLMQGIESGRLEAAIEED